MAVFQGTTGADNLQGGTENDVLIGFAGADTLNGGAGADTMIGGAGNDTYFVDNAGDVVDETTTDANGAVIDATGDDTVNTTISYNLTQFVERLTATGTADVILNGNALANTITGNTGNNVLFGGTDAANAAADTLIGGSGNDTYIIREGADDVIVEDDNDPVAGSVGGNDTVQVVASATRTAYTLAADARVEVLQASDGSSTQALNLTGNQFAQFTVGNAGTNFLSDGGGFGGNGSTVVNNNIASYVTGGADTLVGLGGNDTYTITSTAAVVVEDANGGNDTVRIFTNASGTYNVAANIETIDATLSFGGITLNINGGTNNQRITGNDDGANRINGGGGTDTLVGGAGNDTFIVDSFDDSVTDAGGANSTLDRVVAGSSYALAAASGIEYFTAAGTTLSTRTGQGDGTFNLNALNTTATTNFFVGDNATGQFIFGDAGNNIINGRISATLGANETLGQINDTLIGGAGNDTYRVYSQTDRVIEDTNGGTADFIFTSDSYNLATNDAAVGAITFSDDTLAADGITQAPVTRTISAYVTGAQQIEVLSAADQAAGTTGVTGMTLTGNAYGQIIVGDFNNNVLDDGGSLIGTNQFQDQLSGLGGNDTYIVRAQNTTVNESIGGGTADVVDVRLAATGGFFGLIDRSEVEFVTAVNTDDTFTVGLSGNEFNQVITGNGGDNTFDGRGGQDTLIGGAGNDTYFVTNAQTAGNVTIIEATGTGGGTADAVSTSVSFDLAQNNATVVATAGGQAATIGGIIGIEQIYVTNGQSTNDVNLTGNGAQQLIVGNYGNNILNGDNDTGSNNANGVFVPSGTSAGDTLVGLFGNDTYRVYSQNDVVRENANEGTDTVFTSGNYQLRAGTSIEVLSAANQSSTTALQLIGNALNQTIIGTAGNDTIWGLAGNDTLIGGLGSDTFGFNETSSANADLLQDFTAGDFIGLSTSAFGAVGDALTANEFVVGTAALDADDRIVYNQTTGQVFYDADGNGAGAAVLFATLAAGTSLGFNDFTVIAPPPATPAAA